MAEKANWKDIAELIGIAAIVASLIFVGQQMRLDREIARADAWLQYSDSQISMSELINTHADVWLRGIDGDELSETDQLKFNQIAFAYLQKHGSRYARSVTGVRAGSADAVAKSVAAELYHYPGLRRFAIERWKFNESFRGELSNLPQAVFLYLERYDAGEITPPDPTDSPAF